MSKRRTLDTPLRALALGLLLACGGCETAVHVMPGPTAQLARMEQAQRDGNLAAIERDAPDAACTTSPFGSDACPKIHALRAGACLALARQQAAAGAACPPPSGDGARLTRCAADSYGLAGDAVLAASTEPAAAFQNRMRSRYCAARLVPPPEGLGLAQAALADAARVPPSAAADLLSASAALFIAQSMSASPADRCAAARQARQLAERGLAGAGATPALLDALRGTRTAAGAEAAALAGCNGG